MTGSKNYLNILLLWVRNIGRALRIVDLGSDLRLDLLVDEEEGGRVGVLPNLHCLLCGSIAVVVLQDLNLTIMNSLQSMKEIKRPSIQSLCRASWVRRWIFCCGRFDGFDVMQRFLAL